MEAHNLEYINQVITRAKANAKEAAAHAQHGQAVFGFLSELCADDATKHLVVDFEAERRKLSEAIGKTPHAFDKAMEAYRPSSATSA